MPIREFDGELDNPNVKEFTGELDPEPGLLDPLYKAANKLFKVGSVMDGAPVQPPKQNDVVAEAKRIYPYLKDAPLSHTRTQGEKDGRLLEYWSPNTSGWEWKGKQFNRPKELPLEAHGIEVFSDKVTPKDILGDYVSHHAVNSDPKLKSMYEKFAASIPPKVMEERYRHAVNGGESRPFEEWVGQSGVPEYFRGYTFDQWPGTPYHEIYTPDQINQLDEIKKYLGIDDGRSKVASANAIAETIFREQAEKMRPSLTNSKTSFVDGPAGIAEVAGRRGLAGLGEAVGGAAMAAGDALGIDGLSNFGERANESAKAYGQGAALKAGNAEGFGPDSIVQELPQAAANAGASIIQTAPSLVSNVVLPGSGLPLLFGQVGAQEYGQGVEAGLTGPGAALRAIPQAAAEVIGEKLGGFNTLTSGIRKSITDNSVEPLGRALIQSGMRELPGEELTTTLQFLTDKAPGIGINQDATLADYTKAVKDTALATLLQSGAMTGGGLALQSVADRAAPTVRDDRTVAPEAPVIPVPPVKKDVSELSNAIASTASISSGNIVEVPDDIELDQPATEPNGLKPNADAAFSAKEGDLPNAPDAGIPAPEQPQPVVMPQPEQIAEQIDEPESNANVVLPAEDNQDVTPMTAAIDNDNGNAESITEAHPSDLPQPKIIRDTATQITAPTAGLRPGDIVSAEGAPFATKQLAQKVKKDAGIGWAIKRSGGGFVVRHQPQSAEQIAATKQRIADADSVDTQRDSMLAAIAKLGGINARAVESEWGIKDDLKNLRGAGIKRVATKNGMDIDAMGEALAELGYLSVDEHGKHDNHEFEDLFRGELGGSSHYTPEGFENKAHQDEQGRYEDHLSSRNVKESGYDSLDEAEQDDIEETLNEYRETDEETEARLEREGKELDEAGFGNGMERENEDEIPFSAKGGDRGIDKVASGASTEQNTAERAGNVAESAGDERPQFELETHTKNDLLKRATIEDQDGAKAKAQAEAKNAADAEIGGFTLTGSDRPADVGAARGQGSLFSGNKPQSGLSIEEIREAIANDSFGQEVDVYATLDDAPDYVQEQAKSEGAIGVEGFFDNRTGRVALIAENLDSAERAVEVARHELIGHYGLEGMVGKEEMKRLAQRVIKAEQEGNKTFADVAKHVDRTQPGLSPERRAKEIIAVMAERNMQNSIVRRVIDAIRKFLHSIGIKQNLTDAEVSALLRDAQAYLSEKGRSILDAEEMGVMFSAKGQTDVNSKYPLAGSMVDGREVLDSVPNQGSIDSSIDNPEILPGIREVSFAQFDQMGPLKYYSVSEEARTKKLAEKIRESGQISPLIVVIDEQGPYVLEGGHRFDALRELGAQSFPAMVVLDLDAVDSTMFSAKGNTQAGLKLKPEGIKAKDFVSVGKDKVGRKQSVAGRKIYDKIAGAATDILGKVKLADNAPDSFKKIMREFRVDQTKAQANAKNVAKIGMAQLTTDERKMLSDIIEGYTTVGDMTPEAVGEIAASIQAALAQQGEDLVELGMISRDRLIKNYLPRAYRNPLLARFTNKDIFKSWYQKSRLRISGARLKSRGMVHEIRAGEWLKYKRLGWKLASMSDGSDIPTDLVEAIKLNKEIPPQYPSDLKFIVWRDFTMDEREQMGEIHDGLLRYALGYVETQKDIAIGRLFTAIANDPALSNKRNPGGWAQVPDREIAGADGVKQFGALSGMYVPDYVKDQIERNTQPKGPLMAAYDTALNFWKEGKTVWNPVAHGNNVISNVFTAHFAGLNVADPRVWRNVAREYRTKGKFYQEAIDSGLFGTEWAAVEIQEMFMPDIVGEADIETVSASRFNKVVERLKKIGKPVSFYREKMQKAYEFEDQFFKLMLFIDRRKNGASIEDAINDTERYIFNYSDVPEGVQILKRTYSPFISYTYKALPMLVHTALTRPDRLIAPIVLLGGANWLAYAMIGGDEDEERKNMPDYMKGNTAIGTPKSVRMPFNIQDRPAFMDMSRRVPLGDLFDMNNQTGGLEVPAPMMPSHPLFTATAALMFNKDTFTGKDVTKTSDTDWEVAQKRADWLFKQIVPNAPFIPGAWNFDKLMNGAANAFDTEMAGYTGYTKAGDPTPLGLALLDVAGGTKIRSFDPARNKDFKEYEIDKERKEVQANIRSAMRNQAMPSGKRESYIADQREKMQELTRKRQGL